MRFRLLAALASVVLAVPIASAQNPAKRIIHQQLVWFAYFNRADFGPKWYLVSELQERRFAFPDRQHQFLARTHLHRKFAEGWDVSAGFTWFLQSPQDPLSTSTLVVPELRPHVQVDGRNKVHPRVELVHRYRCERRFFRNVENDALVKGYDGWFRFRYRLTLQYTLWSKDERSLKANVSDEIHFNLGSRVVMNSFDQNRIYAGLGYSINKQLAVGMGYMNWFQQRRSGVDYYDRDIVRFIVEHRIGRSTPRVRSED